METEGLEDPGYENSLIENLSREYSGVKLDLVIVAAYPALRFAVAHREQKGKIPTVLSSGLQGGHAGLGIPGSGRSG